MSVTLEGRFYQFLDMLLHLQEGDRAIRIDEVKLTQGEKELPELVVTISASAFLASNGR